MLDDDLLDPIVDVTHPYRSSLDCPKLALPAFPVLRTGIEGRLKAPVT
jgi:hypothetical protein